jgi:predicted transcriptional regulator
MTMGAHGRRIRADGVLRIGIASYEEVKERTMKIARGELKPGPRDPKIFFPSMESAGKVLSGKNRELLRCIRERKPASLRDLSVIVDRAPSNLSRTLKSMERYGLVTLAKGSRGTLRPTVDYEEIDIRIGVAARTRDGHKPKVKADEPSQRAS